MAPRPTTLPLAYRVFFLIVEPASALVGAFYAHFRQSTYLALTDAGSAPAASSPVPAGTSVALSQLANLYVLFALNEALVLRCTGDLTVWRVLLLVLLVADLGHLLSLAALGRPAVYWDVAAWNAVDWGNVPFVYLGAAMRVAFLAGVGLGGGGGARSGAGVGAKPRKTA
ncbi:putative NADP-dependent alcohol dehydrogenase-like protein [Rosellinia necatrix]|uniref:Putative NADP-dependent alcohol dehydrogenase-like protein n=1 Tax=Rosellinia necatrix TaxID=77044 RepID=A0A1W2TJT2_ROSNE|nr:putative NADP-dependent alcohol dehydrogenase-like protein [Rosellinia necatrix]